MSIDHIDGVVVVSGEVDAHTCATLDEALGAATGLVRVDLSKVTFMDSSGLRVLVRRHQDLQQAGGRLEIVQPSRPVQRLFEISGLVGQLDVT